MFIVKICVYKFDYCLFNYIFQAINPFDELQAPSSVNNTSVVNDQLLQPELQNMGYDNNINQVSTSNNMIYSYGIKKM